MTENNTIVDNESGQGQHALYCSTMPISHTHSHKFFLCT